MLKQHEATKAALMDEVAAEIHKKLPADRAPVVERFARGYYGGVAAEDVSARTVLDLYGAVISLFNYAAERRPDEPRVRVYSPRMEDHGWRSMHSVVEIVSADMPFIVDSTSMELNRHGQTIHLMVHPVLTVRRDAKGRLIDVLTEADEPGADALCESFVHVEMDRQSDPAILQRLEADLCRVLGDVRTAVEDWPEMRRRAEQIVEAYAKTPPPVEAGEHAESLDFIRWLLDNHFTFLGYRKYDLTDNEELVAVPQSGLGILRERPSSSTRPKSGPPDATSAVLSADIRELALAHHVLYMTKANSRATVHRPSYLDYIGVKRFGPDGSVIGEWRFLGLYTSGVYHASPLEIPLVRERLHAVIQRAGFPAGSHNEKRLLDILETYPRDELFQISDDELYDIVMGIHVLQERQRVRLFVRRDTFGRFLSCLVYVPRDRYNTDVRKRFAAVLTQAFDGSIADFSARLSESVLARLHFIIRTDAADASPPDVAEVEARLVKASRSWRDDLHAVLVEGRGEEEGNRLFATYADAFPAAFREAFPALNAVYDIARMESLRTDGESPGMSLYHPLEAEPGFLRFKLFWPVEPPLLSDVLPLLENMGLKVVDQRRFEVRPASGPAVWLDDFGLIHSGTTELEAANLKEIFSDAFATIWRGEADNDRFNRLVLGARLTWRESSVLRTYAKYLRQAGITFSQAYMESTVTANPDVARLLIALFHGRLDPARTGSSGGPTVDDLTGQLEAALDRVANLDDDRILRSFLSVICATLRTNYYQKCEDGQPKPYLALKFDPSQIPLLPAPRPLFEVFVSSPRVEAVHLRGGKVARGGIRWSDRPEDFRTEVLGLMKAQMVKNTVIVPLGAKGGFVVKRPPAGGDRDAVMQEVIACYSTFMRGLLDVTDNYVGDEVVAPPDVVCHDEPDPYLVVAADKGTATFSDIANAIAVERGYWLGDAFASGGSAGYDHKEMGITARGAWESVRRHFREMGVDTQKEDFTVAGIGDMSGDVFGNGMLLSPHIRLLGAFNHLHVFLDPDPDPTASLAERERLFRLPRSTWADYDVTKLSAGGGVFPRTAKSIPLTPEVRRALAVDADRLTPNELIRALLRAPVDLLWNGGIGTYVKASAETHAQVGDRATDALRVDATELRCRVVGEGGNLGLTQRGRIEYALAGGRINTDFIDNSAGVDTSDHEVNLKILLNQALVAGDITEKQRNAVLADMTDEVAKLVLIDNYRQAQALSVTELQAASAIDRHARLMRTLEREGRLDRALEFLPDDKEVAARQAAGLGLTRPELAVLLAYSKNTVYAGILDSDVPEDPYLSAELLRYLPEPMRATYGDLMQEHRLRREIIATMITNGVINRVGSSFINWLKDETGAETGDVARAYTVAREIFQLVPIWRHIEALDEQVHAHVQAAMVLESRRLVERASLWLLRSRRQPMEIAAEVAYFSPGVQALYAGLPQLVVGADLEAMEERIARLVNQNVPPDLATRVGALSPLASALDIIEVAHGSDRLVEEVATVYFTLGARLDLDWLRAQIVALPTGSHWQGLAKASLRDDLYIQHRGLAAGVLRSGKPDTDPKELVDSWVDENRRRVRRCLDTFGDLRNLGPLDLSMLSAAMRELRNLAQTGGMVANSGSS